MIDYLKFWIWNSVAYTKEKNCTNSIDYKEIVFYCIKIYIFEKIYKFYIVEGNIFEPIAFALFLNIYTIFESLNK